MGAPNWNIYWVLILQNNKDYSETHGGVKQDGGKYYFV